jgi:hypothetical protein
VSDGEEKEEKEEGLRKPKRSSNQSRPGTGGSNFIRKTELSRAKQNESKAKIKGQGKESAWGSFCFVLLFFFFIFLCLMLLLMLLLEYHNYCAVWSSPPVFLPLPSFRFLLGRLTTTHIETSKKMGVRVISRLFAFSFSFSFSFFFCGWTYKWKCSLDSSCSGVFHIRSVLSVLAAARCYC